VVVVVVVQAQLQEKPKFVTSMTIEEEYVIFHKSIRDISSHLTPRGH
jgi:hypothetical protein